MQNIAKIIKLSKPQHKWIIVASIVITLQAVLQQATPILFKCVVDELSAQFADGTGSYSRLVWLFGLILSINLGIVIFNTANQRLGDFIASRLGRYLTEIYYKQILIHPKAIGGDKYFPRGRCQKTY